MNSGCLKSLGVAGGVVVFLVVIVPAGCVGIFALARSMGMFEPSAQQRAAASPKALSEDEKRLGEKPVYCPGFYLEHLGMFSGGPPCVVEGYLAKTLKDPASFKPLAPCTVTPTTDAWEVSCAYRAKNSFGALTVENRSFFIRGGKLVKVQ